MSGHLSSMASKVAVPEATITTSAAVIAACAWPCTTVIGNCGARARTRPSNNSRVAAVASGATKERRGRAARHERQASGERMADVPHVYVVRLVKPRLERKQGQHQVRRLRDLA